MKVLQPFYYDDFKCIGGECKNTCCAGWAIMIDRKSFLKYKKIKGDFGKQVEKAIKRNRKNTKESQYGMFILDADRKCPLLNEEGLCSIYINEGESSMCDVCKVYPREHFQYNDKYLERNLSASCPEIAKKLVYTKEKFSFDMRKEEMAKDDIQVIYKFDGNRDELYNMLWEARSVSIDIAQLDNIPIWQRLIYILFLEKRMQKLIDNKQLSNYPQVLHNFVDELSNNINNNSINKVNEFIKFSIISNILRQKNYGKLNESMEKLKKIIDNNTNEDIENIFRTGEREFNEYFKDREYIYENYIVYAIYSNYIKAIGTNDLHEKVVMTILQFAVLKLILFSFWYDKKTLEYEEIVDIIVGFSRNLQHDPIFLREIYKWIKDNKFDTPGYLATIIY